MGDVSSVRGKHIAECSIRSKMGKEQHCYAITLDYSALHYRRGERVDDAIRVHGGNELINCGSGTITSHIVRHLGHITARVLLQSSAT